MKKSVILAVILTFVAGVVGQGVLMPYKPKFEDALVVFENSWRTECFSDGLSTQIYLDLNITNNGKKTIKNLYVAYKISIFRDNIEEPYTVSRARVNLLRVDWPAKTIASGETVSVGLQIMSMGTITDENGLTSPSFDLVNKMEIELYVYWIQYTWFGGQWGDIYADMRSNIGEYGVRNSLQSYIRP